MTNLEDETMGANQLTIRDQRGNILGTANVGSRAMTWRDRTGTLRSMRDTAIQGWIYGNLERLAESGGDQQAYLDQVVTVSDEYNY